MDNTPPLHVSAIGATHELDGFALAGATVFRTHTDQAIIDAWQFLDSEAGLVVLTPHAHQILHTRLQQRPQTLTVVTP